jgi:hypothetical protein
VGLRFHDSHSVNVMVANSDHVAYSALTNDVAIRIADEYFTMDCYAIPLDCYDLVLDVKYLGTLGHIL